ncbi:MAG: NYN domain-containing protein [Pseudomonadota bacterium]|nr:NYN domain-containing protein [Pseudomonadota bacterium]
MKTALFVDFDNVFSGLKRLDPAYAERFARYPDVWMKWLAEKLPLPPYVDQTARRRILVRRCYLNPSVYQRYRFNFSQSGFEIVDCPPMTFAGKTSTDIHMVLDMVDVLQHSTHYDEFIVFSADADFSPVLRKLRRSDRRTTVLAAGQTSSAYEASADLMIDPDDFIGDALGFDDERTESEAHSANVNVPQHQGQIQQAERLVYQTVDSAKAPVPLIRLAQVLGSQIPNLNKSGWADAQAFRDFLKQLSLAPLIIDDVNATILDPRRLTGDKNHEEPEIIQLTSSNGHRNEETARHIIVQEVAGSNRPVSCALLAQVVKSRATDVGTNWNGHGSFRRFLESLALENLQMEWHFHGGVVLDPARHTLPDDLNKAAPGRPDEAWQGRELLWTQVSPVFSMSNLPALSPRKYGVALACLSLALQDSEFSLLETGKRVFDLIVARQEGVSRRDVNQLIRAMLFGGFVPASGATDVKSLTVAVCGIGLAACAREGMVVDDALRTAVFSWIGGEMAIDT